MARNERSDRKRLEVDRSCVAGRSDHAHTEPLAGAASVALVLREVADGEDVPPTTYAKHLVRLEPRTGRLEAQPNLPTLTHIQTV